jgi:hypothetical protein
MPQNPVPTTPSVCTGTTSTGAPCRRHVRAGAECCWQHSYGLKRKWSSLTRNQSIVFILSCIGVVGVSISFAAWRFPDFWRATPRPRLHVTKYELIRETNTGTPGVNVFFRVEGAGAGLVDCLSRIVVTKFPGDDKEVELENSLFDGMLKRSAPDKNLGETSAGRELYVTLVGTPLPDDVWMKVRGKTAAVYFMGRFRYSDKRGVYHSDYCGFFMGDPAPVFACHYHNSEP